MTKKSIWVLTSVLCNYDQPPHNLEAWWSEKPTVEQLTKMIYPNVEVMDGLIDGLEALIAGHVLNIPHCVDYDLCQWVEED